jgi:hypothetical protein
VQVKALACELPSQFGLPLSRWSLAELNEQVCQSGLVAKISDSTLWRWLHEDAIRPWFHRCWIFPRDPQFAAKAGRLLDLYQRVWQGQPLQADEFVISADEKTSIQARARIHPTQAPQPGQPMKVEHEYERRGALTYLAALDVHRAKLFGHCEPQNGIVAFDRLVDRVMNQPPYAQARRVFWIVDNGSSHRGTASVQRLQQRYPVCNWSMDPFTAVGSIRSKSTFPSSSEKCSRQTISNPWMQSPTPSGNSNAISKRSDGPSSGSLRAKREMDPIIRTSG